MKTKNIYIYGAGPSGLEILELIDVINLKKKIWKVKGFIDVKKSLVGKKIGKNWSLPRACSYTTQEKLDLLLRLIFWKKNLFSMVLESGIDILKSKQIFQKSSEIEIIKFWASFMTSTLIF